MGKGKVKKIVGSISDDVVEQYKLYEYRNKKIVQSLDLYIHIAKHANEFESVDSFNNAVSNIENIIANPYFVYHDSKRNSLLYFKEIDENVCIVVKLSLQENKDTYVSTLYPISKSKIEKYKELSYITNR